MDWLWVALGIVLVAVVSAAIAYARGREAGERSERAASSAGDVSQVPSPSTVNGGPLPSVFDCRVGEAVARAMPDTLIITDTSGRMRYASPGERKFGLIDSGRIVSAELCDLLAQVASDGQTREREVSMPLDPADRFEHSGRGVQAGEAAPSDMLYLKVRVGSIGDGLVALFLRDMSEQRRFEAMRRDFVTNVSHELKTPAGAISLLAETVSDASDDPDAVRYFAGRITKESERLTELVHRLIDLQKAQTARAVIDAKPLDVLVVAREAIAENAVQAEGKGIDLLLSLDGKSVPLAAGDGTDDGTDDVKDENTPAIMADEESIVSAIKNLVENAIHYSPEHTTVRVAIESGKRGENGDRSVTIRVIDQGIGIPRESLGRIFERFYRVDPARSRQTGGTGLGLAIVKHCVEDCGGTISVWSHEGEGSTFTIELPEASEAAEMPEAPEVPAHTDK